jgi:hypothetical protein
MRMPGGVTKNGGKIMWNIKEIYAMTIKNIGRINAEKNIGRINAEKNIGRINAMTIKNVGRIGVVPCVALELPHVQVVYEIFQEVLEVFQMNGHCLQV